MTLSRLIRPLIIAFLILMSGLGACATGNFTGWSVPERTLTEQTALLREHVEIRLPEAASGPVPAAILLHGCGGLRDVQEDYASALLTAGYGVVLVDSNSARGIGRFGAMTQVCTAQRLWGQERAADIPAAIAIASESPGIDADRLALIGWSHGGWTVLEALDFAGEDRTSPVLSPQPSTPLPGVRTAIAIYPYCGFPVRADGRGFASDIPLHALLGGRDVVAPARDCERLFARAAEAGRPVNHELWSNVTHAFDEPNGPPDPRMEYDADAAQRARASVISWLDEAFADQG
jgi:dienelactone hydrolase